MKIWAPGSWVLIGKDVEAQFTAINIRSAGMTYEVVYWTSGTRNCVWVEDVEVVGKSAERLMEIGFQATDFPK